MMKHLEMKKKSMIMILISIGLAITLTTSFLLLQNNVLSEAENMKEPSTNNDRITIGMSRESENLLIMVADTYGFFSEEGLDVSLKEYPSGKLALNEGLFAGETDFATPADVPIVFSSFERNDFSVVANIGHSYDVSKIVARSDKGISNPIDLEGKKIGTQKESSVHFFLNLFLLKHNIPEKNIQILYKQPEELPGALADGQIDAFSMREPFVSQARDLLGDKIIIFEEPDLYQKTYSLVAFNKFIEENPQIIKKVLLALIKAEEFVKGNPEESIKLISKTTNISESEVAANWSNFDFVVSIDQAFLFSLDEHAAWAISEKFVNANAMPNYLDYVHTASLKEVKPGAIKIFG